MNTLKQYFDLKNPIHLSVGQTEEAKHIVDTFFESQTLSSLRQDLRTWYEAVISSNHPAYESGTERSNLFFLYNQLELLTEAVYILHVKKEEGD